MVANGSNAVQVSIDSNYDRETELKAFDDTKAGVKGLVDAGVATVPRIFIQPPCNSSETPAPAKNQFSFPVIDLAGIRKDPIRRKKAVGKIRDAVETGGFFQVINHGIAGRVLAEALDGTRRFHEQDADVRKQWYTRDAGKGFVYNSNFNLYSAPAACWRDTFNCTMAPKPPNPEELPEACRAMLVEYSKEVTQLGDSLFELLSEALGLNPSHLKDIGCADGLVIMGHYYPACPQPELTMGTSEHADSGFLTVLLQDQLGGLQVHYQNQWVNILPTPGALVVNIGDILQLVTNDKFKSSKHRVLANRIGPRVSVACFFTTAMQPSTKVFKPINELLSEDDPPKYRETTVREFKEHTIKCLDGTSALLHFKL
ncbi:hypothetical protein U1Q18_015611 [Sarracenia purpurea var. burkii]